MKNTFPLRVVNPESLDLLSKKVDGIQKIRGNKEQVIRFVSSLHNANKDSLVVCSATDSEKIKSAIRDTSASMIVVSRDIGAYLDKTLIITKDPIEWFINALNLLVIDSLEENIATKTATGAPIIGSGTLVGTNTVIEENCTIGSHCTIGANCFIGGNVVIGDNVFIQNNTSIGGIGLGYHITKDGKRMLLPHLGFVLIGNDAVIGSGCSIVRGQLQDTIVGRGSRLGNLVNIGHNVKIGSNCSISSNTCLAGGVSVGNNSNIAAGVSINAKLDIGNNCQIGLGSVVVKSIPSGVSVFGVPAKPLPTMRKF